MSRVGLRRFRAPGPACAGRAAKNARPGLAPGRCKGKAHDADHLGYAGRRVLVSRKWSGKTLADHRADRKDWPSRRLVFRQLTRPGMRGNISGETCRNEYVWVRGSPRVFVVVVTQLVARWWRYFDINCQFANLSIR